MGIKAADVIDYVDVVRTYPHKYTNPDGTPVVFRYRFREPGQDEVNRHLNSTVGKKTANREKVESDMALAQFCDFIHDVPEGFDDIPRQQNGDGEWFVKPEDARSYFGQNERMRVFAAQALGGLWRAVLPEEMFS
jgi:hypothetical protein